MEKEGNNLQPFFNRLEGIAREGGCDRNGLCMIENLLFLRRTEWNHITAVMPEPSVVIAAHDPYVSHVKIFLVLKIFLK